MHVLIDKNSTYIGYFEWVYVGQGTCRNKVNYKKYCVQKI